MTPYSVNDRLSENKNSHLNAISGHARLSYAQKRISKYFMGHDNGDLGGASSGNYLLDDLISNYHFLLKELEGRRLSNKNVEGASWSQRGKMSYLLIFFCREFYVFCGLPYLRENSLNPPTDYRHRLCLVIQRVFHTHNPTDNQGNIGGDH